MKPLAVLRPEPGNAATAARIAAAGARTIRLPLFAVGPLAWTPPDPAVHDALLLTSANAVRQAGPGLAGYRTLPVHAVGAAPARSGTTSPSWPSWRSAQRAPMRWQRRWRMAG